MIDRVVEHWSASRWVWSETFGRGEGPKFRVTRIPLEGERPMREEIVHKSNLADCLEDLVPGAYAVLVQHVSE